MYQIIFHKDKNGKNEVEEYIRYLENKKNIIKECKIKYTKIIMYMDLLSRNGLKLGEPYIKHLKSNIWELRPIRDRILFSFIENNKFIILNKFIKRTQKTPNKEVEKAMNLLKGYKERGC